MCCFVLRVSGLLTKGLVYPRARPPVHEAWNMFACGLNTAFYCYPNDGVPSVRSLLHCSFHPQHRQALDSDHVFHRWFNKDDRSGPVLSFLLKHRPMSHFPAGPSGHRGTSLASYNCFASVAQPIHTLSNTCHTIPICPPLWWIGADKEKKNRWDFFLPPFFCDFCVYVCFCLASARPVSVLENLSCITRCLSQTDIWAEHKSAKILNLSLCSSW